MSASQRDKGARGEREFCRDLSAHLGETLTRQLGAARDGGPDVLLGDRWAIEVKRGEEPRIAAWWAQAWRQAVKAERWPALAYRPNRQLWTVIVPLDVVMWGTTTWECEPALVWTAALSLAGFAAVVRECIEPPRRPFLAASGTECAPTPTPATTTPGIVL